MKKLLLLLLPALSFSQGLSISTQYTNEELVNNILMGSSCIEAGNIQTQGDCGIAHFSTTGSNAFFEEGIIIRSGNATHTQGSYSGQNQSSVCSDIGDADLQAIVQGYGMSGSINDVSFLKFDFIASSDYMSFEFIFASNEYGTYQCSFGDSFAFILTDLTTGISQNLAVIPQTNIPVSVVTIRDGAYNDGCPSQNINFFGQMNTIGDLLNMKGQTIPMMADAYITPNHPYSIKLVIGDYADSILDSAVFIKAGSFNTGCSSDKIKMVSFLDENQNGTQDMGELIFNQGNFFHELNNNGQPSQVYSQDGAGYVFAIDYDDTHNLSFQINSEYSDYYTSATTYSNVIIDENSGENVYYFPVVNTDSYSDTSVTFIPIGSPVAGSQQIGAIVYRNMGTLPASGTLTFSHSEGIAISEVSETVTPSTNGFTFEYTDLLPFETRIIEVTYNTVAASGDLILSEVSITSNGETEEVIQSNNTFQQTIVVADSHVPNDVTESHGGEIVYTEFGDEDYLYYTIKFQNTAMTPTNFMRIINNLPDGLNEETFEMVYTSHGYNLIKNGSELNWFFEDIALAPQAQNNTTSQGFVTFRVKPTSGYTAGTVIENQAKLFFDYNPPITTDTFTTQFVNPSLSISESDNNSFTIYPNPTEGQLQIQVINFSKPVNYIITDITAKVIVKGSLSQAESTISLAEYTQGIYFIKIFGEAATTTHKIIKK
ncbi:MAG: choice-of-anchor L domain-containing protein [Flavobacteriaceae bacterium]